MITIGKQSARNSKIKQLSAQENKHTLLISALFGCLFFILESLFGTDTGKTLALVCSIVGLLVIAFRQNILAERFSIPFLALTLFVLMNGVSSFYAISGKFGLREFLKILSAYTLGIALLGLSPKVEKLKGSFVMTVIALCGALGSLVSIDLLSTRYISGTVLGFFSWFTEEYTWLEGVEAGVRMTSMFANPNVFAGFAGIGVLMSLGLSTEAVSGKNRCFYLVLLYLNALGFVLAFSLGASGFIAMAFLVFLLLQHKEKRGGVLVLMLETLVLVAVSAAIISSTSFQAWQGVQPIPLLCAIFGSLLLCLLDGIMRTWVTLRFQPKGKLIPIMLGSLIALLVVFLIAAWNLTGEVELAPGEALRRAIYLEPGEYTLDLQAEGPVIVTVESQNRRETMMHTNTVLYSGDAYQASFTVPEDSLVQYFNFYAGEGGRLTAAYCGTTKIPLKYKLLPGFIANRLQGLLANENAIQRLVFFEDGLKLFKRSPVIGLGMGAYENGIKSVQSFYYETKYAHDHYIQVLVEIGVVGLILFLCLLFTVGAAVWRSRKTQPYAPTLGAALVFMAGHAITEVVFSTYAYLPMAFGVFILIDLCCGETIKKPKLSMLARKISLAVIAVFIFVYGIFIVCNMAANDLIERQPSLYSVEKAVRLDKFEWADYALAYVTNTMGDDVGLTVRIQADEYAERLSKVNSNTIPIYLAQYYFSTGRTKRGFEMLEKYVDYLASDTSAWQNAFDMARQLDPDNDIYQRGMTSLVEKLDAWNAENMGTIQLDEATQAFIAQYR